ncbi:MAG: RimK/LysX family protein [Gammaproteobacteria bacterium]|nr:RimK/LysX family protein [Gammaproteobacteria bacterium]MCH9717212.1 RimK/LysX family protein [Gammaproteobacteria bacterium]MCH9762969.1 RimK/LysX family protein [Gammaproteobacteria bacterium]
MFFRIPFILLCILFFGQALADSAVHSKVVYGYLERAVLLDKQLSLKAKLDTGAKSASLYAKRIRHISKGGKIFVQFVVPTKKGDILFTCPYVGDVSIKARSGEIGGVRIKNPFINRPVVSMPIKLGLETRTIRVNLANRRRFTYPLLLGREALLAFNGVVDPAQKFTCSPKVKKR